MLDLKKNPLYYDTHSLIYCSIDEQTYSST